MLSENIKAVRKSKGLSQQELSVKLNVVRQTVSKWEQGLSVPDSDMLISISEALETPVATLLGENVLAPEVDGLKAISAKLEVINLQLAQMKDTRKRLLQWFLIALCAVTAAVFAVLSALGSPYQGWDYSDPETAVLGAALHSLEWLFVRAAPVIFAGAIIGIFLTRWDFQTGGFSKMNKKRIGAAIAIAAALGLGFILYKQATPGEYAPADDEIALCIQLDIKEDIGLLLIDYDANGSGGCGGISNADKSLLKHDERLFYTLPAHAFDDPSDVKSLSIQFAVITEYVEPNFEKIYPEEYTISVDAISLNADFGEAYSITIRGDRANGYEAVLNE